MITNLNEYLLEQNEMIDEFHFYSPQIESIRKANESGMKLLKNINNSVYKIDELAFENIDIDKIKKDLNIELKENINKKALLEIYKEIENEYNLEGRVSLTEYLLQGNIILSDLENKLLGKVDYSIAYSEEELRKREKEAAIRHCMVTTFQSTLDTSEYLKLSKEGMHTLKEYDRYLSILPTSPEVENINEQILNMGYSLLALESLDKMGCEIEDSIGLNNEISNKIRNLLLNINEYQDDPSVQRDFKTLLNINENLCELDSNFSDIYQEHLNKLQIIEEGIYQNENVHQNSNVFE